MHKAGMTDSSGILGFLFSLGQHQDKWIGGIAVWLFLRRKKSDLRPPTPLPAKNEMTRKCSTTLMKAQDSSIVWAFSSFEKHIVVKEASCLCLHSRSSPEAR